MIPIPPVRSKARVVARVVLAASYFGIGIVHLTAADKFLPIMPDWVPDPRDVVLATGVCEVVGSVALLTPRLRRAAGFAFAAYAVCVFPANIKHALDGIDLPPIPKFVVVPWAAAPVSARLRLVGAVGVGGNRLAVRRKRERGDVNLRATSPRLDATRERRL